MEINYSSTVKTTILLEKDLLEEIAQLNPYSTRKEFINRACKAYLQELKRQFIDEKLSAAVSESATEDRAVNEEWESVTLEVWK